jgi:hypothetical protein
LQIIKKYYGDQFKSATLDLKHKIEAF